MNKVKVSLREIMEDDNHPLMQRWVDQFDLMLKEKNPKLYERMFKSHNQNIYNVMIRDSLTGKTTDSDSVNLGSNPGP